ncbi:uncharacterized protein BDFB_013930, partial [Asbolus verrucosus]
MCDRKIEEYIKLALKVQDLTDWHVDVAGKANKEDGYIGDITFVRVTGKTTKKTFDLVIKASKESEKLRHQAPVKEAFEKEIFVYNEVKTAFDEFQRDKGIAAPLQIMPHCYATRITEGSEVLIFDNLKTENFDLWDKTKPMTFGHIKLILENYGKWHAISLALKKERPQVYGRLIKDNINMFGYFITKVKMLDYFVDIFEKAKNTVIASDETEILTNLQFSGSDIIHVLTDMLLEDPDSHVIIHGDCWNNNFLFKFEDNPTQPLDVRILDWQCAGVSSPVIDLSHFIYSCCDTGVYKNVRELLAVYYESLSQYLKQLGCDYNEIFPFSKLIEHWRRFSSYGMVLSSYIIKACLCKPEDTPDWADSAEQGKQFRDNFNYGVADEDVYFTRVRNNLLHYAHNKNCL